MQVPNYNVHVSLSLYNYNLIFVDSYLFFSLYTFRLNVSTSNALKKHVSLNITNPVSILLVALVPVIYKNSLNKYYHRDQFVPFIDFGPWNRNEIPNQCLIRNSESIPNL